ncbi:hypothetical protein GGX14DRAFT_586818 [Mycena pura]|uniref:F-box domain-containing protein n=1 Tax=Mycena pura TaxID=153505 RepID=A0AAD6UTE0_9AGAR|nr:hypothetical protein GGX14DRAFT_586818 [Mycena pura]
MLRLGDVSPLCAVPREVLERIAYELACLTPLGPPSALIPLLLTCKTVNARLSRNKALYSQIFRLKFDTSAVRRRAFEPTPSQYYDQLVLYCTQLQKLRGQVRADDCDDVLFAAFLMMLENDGRNAAQLEHAGLDSYLDIFVRSQLWNDRYTAHGWPTDNTANACALWLVWMTTTEQKLKAESAARREQIIALVLPYVLVPYRYASSFAPHNHFELPLRNTTKTRPNTFITSHGPYPVYLDPRRVWSQVHYSSRPAIVPPLVAVAAKLVYFSRRETVPFSVPPHLPVDREQALAAGVTDISATQADLHELNAHLNKGLPEHRPGWGPESEGADMEPLSKCWDTDWWRLRKCFDAWREADRRLGLVYEPGTFTGLWQGRMLIPGEHHMTALITTLDYPPDFDEGYLGTTTVPLFMRIAEHHSYAPDFPAPCGNAEGALEHGYFPPQTHFVAEDAGSVVLRVGEDGAERYKYATFGAPGAARHDPYACTACRAREDALRARRARAAAAAHEELFARLGLAEPASDDDDEMDDDDPPAQDPAREPPCNGIQDIIFTGATDLRHGQAWSSFEFYGRVRPWDGMIGILRVSSDPRKGTLLFYGFIVGGHKFVGNWRAAHQEVGAPAWESAFSAARRDD